MHLHVQPFRKDFIEECCLFFMAHIISALPNLLQSLEQPLQIDPSIRKLIVTLFLMMGHPDQEMGQPSVQLAKSTLPDVCKSILQIFSVQSRLTLWFCWQSVTGLEGTGYKIMKPAWPNRPFMWHLLDTQPSSVFQQIQRIRLTFSNLR